VLNRVWLIWQTLLSHYRQHPAQGLFLLIGLSLGVAILLGTLIVSESAKVSFQSGQKVLGGQVVATIHPLNGGTTFAETLYTELRKKGFTQIMPLVEGRVRLENGRFLAVQGTDAFALMSNTSKNSSGQPTAQNSTADGNEGQGVMSLLAFSFPPYQSLIAQTFADRVGFENGDTPVLADGRKLPAIKVVSDDLGIGYNILCDIRCSQDLLSLPGQLTSIALTAQPVNKLPLTVAQSDAIEQLKQWLPPDVALSFPERNVQNQALSDAFFLNITAVSFLAFLVGCFIAFNAVRFSVLQRLNMVKQLRLTGVTFEEIALALLLELLFWALLASVVGCLLGWFFAGLLLPDVGLTLVQLFQGENILSMGAMHNWWAMALLISLIATVTATVQPFWRLARQQPLQNKANFNSQNDGALDYRQLIALALLLIGGLLTLLPGSQALGFIITACWFIGGALLVPKALSALYGGLEKMPRLLKHAKLHWAITDGKFNYARLSVAMMAFTVAIAAGIAVTTLVSSFRITLEDYLSQALSESLYLTPEQTDTLPIFDYLSQHPDVALAYRYLHTNTTLIKPSGSFVSYVRSLTDDKIRQDSVGLEKQVDNLWPRFHRRQGILINQTLAFQQQLGPGDTVAIKLNERQVEVEVLGVYYSYGSTIASLIIDQGWLEDLWPKVNSIEVGVFMQAGLPVEPLLEALQEKFALQSHHYIKPQEMKGLALAIFEQTFAATNLLTIFTLLIAAIGIYCACYAAEMDKQRQLSLLKVLGVNSREITWLSLLQLFFNALVACLIALPLGLLIAWASVHIVLQYSFGWHFAVQVQPLVLAGIVGVAILIALLAGLIPLYRLSQKTVIDTFRESV